MLTRIPCHILGRQFQSFLIGNPANFPRGKPPHHKLLHARRVLRWAPPPPPYHAHSTFAGWGLFLLVGEVGLSSGGCVNDPSKSVEYMLVNRSLLALELGRAGNTLDDPVCFPRMILADLALSRASFTTASLSASRDIVSGPGGVNLAFAERERGLSLVPGRCFNSAMITTPFDISLRERATSRTLCTWLCFSLGAHDLEGGARIAHLVTKSTGRF